MIVVKVETCEDSAQLAEVKHVSELKRMGVPMRGNRLVEGVEAGSLTLSEQGAERTYTWLSEPVERSKNPLSKRFRIRRFNTLGETWYEVQEWKWYWPMWDTWTIFNTYTKTVEPIRYKDLHIAREAVRFYQRKEEPHFALIYHL